MRFDNSAEYDAAINDLVRENTNLINTCKEEVRSLTEEENSIFENRVNEINALKEEKNELLRSIENLNLKNISIDKKMENEFSLIRSLSEAYNSGKRDNIVINRTHTVAAEGEDIVPVDLVNELIMPLREEYLFGQLPVRVRTNLSGNVQIPIFGGGSLSKDAHVGETGLAAEYTSSFDSITLTPHRFSVWTTISKQWLIQSIPAATDALVEDLSRQFWDKIESLLLSDASATENKPAGLLKGLEAVEVETYKDLCNFEADLREKKYRNVSFAISPRAEAAFKSTIMGTNNTGMIMSGGKVDGLNTVVTSNIEPNQFLLADWSNVQFGFWENPTVSFFEDFQLAQNGQVGIILSGFYDVKLLRDDAIALGEVVEAEAGEGGEG